MSSRLPFMLIGLSALGACATSVAPPPGPVVATAADQHRIEVTQTTARLEIDVDPAGLGDPRARGDGLDGKAAIADLGELFERRFENAGARQLDARIERPLRRWRHSRRGYGLPAAALPEPGAR